MEFVRNWLEIAENIKAVVLGAESGNADVERFFKDLILRGTCFLAAHRGDETVFAPSKFIGYASNSPDQHTANPEKDGRDTNPAIAAILEDEWTPDDELEILYQQYCVSLGLKPRATGSFGVSRKYIDVRDRIISWPNAKTMTFPTFGVGKVTLASESNGKIKFDLPPVPEIEILLELIANNKKEDRPEADTRRLVEKFLLRLGHSEKCIAFEVGRIDVSVSDATGKTWAVIEVKTSLNNKWAYDDGLRKGFDYANRTGARLVIVTDADIYEIYDRKKGDDYKSQLCGRFQLTRFEKDKAPLLDLLRPHDGK